MPEVLCILSCNLFLEEVAAAVRAEGWDDVEAIGFPVRCGRPPLRWEELRRLLPDNCGKAMVLGVACLNNMREPPSDFPPLQLVSLKQCFELVAGGQLVGDLLDSGAYLATPAWLRNWENHLLALGFAAEHYAEFFNEFSKELILLDTGIDPNAGKHLSELETKTRISVRRLAVGLDHLRLLLTKAVLEWRLVNAKKAEENRNREHARELADHLAAMDMLAALAQAQHESQAISVIEDLFGMLFAPSELYYLRIENNIPIAHKSIPDAELFALNSLNEDYAWTGDNRGFLLRIRRGGEELGRVAVCKLAFPEYRSRYLNMALAIMGVCGLAIENARNRLRLMEIEKMKSLGILVAGVAHEINTPLGVSMTAISALQQKSQTLASRFRERSMTQTDLEAYLKQTQESGSLILSNLERIGRLTDVFRQVGAHGEKPAKRRFKLKDCVDQAIKSYEGELGERISVTLQCDAELEMEGTPDDWLSIFSNLINNSVKHGFKDLQRGNIGIRIVIGDKRLDIDYRDDGKGMPPEVLAKVFDPFFTTDLQQGMGLGMHLVYNLITQRLNGRIVCQSQPSQGVLFHIETPL